MTKILTKMLNDFIAPKFENIPNITMLQTTRLGGVSSGVYSTFNLSFNNDDNISDVKKNFQKLEQIVPEIYWINQSHSDRVIKLPSKDLDGDAVFTYEKNLVCAVRTADCLPILLGNKNGSMVAAIHAGWRSLGAGIIEKTLDIINSDSEIYAWLGPSISIEKFVVGSDVYDFFRKNDPKILNSFTRYHDKYKLCLPTAAKYKLINKGVKKIFGSTIDEYFCTYNDNKRFFSYRRDKVTGRMASLIWINN